VKITVRNTTTSETLIDEFDKRTPFRGDLDKRIELDGNADEKRAIFRGDLGKRTPFRADLGKRVPFTVDLGKPAHLGKQNAFREAGPNLMESQENSE